MIRLDGLHERIEAGNLDFMKILDTVLECNPDLVNIIDPNYKLLYSNGRLLDKFDGRKGEHCYEFLKCRDGVCDNCRLEEVFKRGVSLDYIEHDIVKDMYFHIFFTPIKDSIGNVVSVVQHIKDVTSVEKTKYHIIQALQAAESGSQAKTAFLANVNHVLRTPINGALGLLQILQEEVTNSEHLDLIRLIIGSVKSLHGDLETVIAYSDVNRNEMSMNNVKTDFILFLDSILLDIRNKCRLKKVDFDCHIDEKIPDELTFDPDCLKKILEVFLSNAVKYTSKGVIDLSVEYVSRFSNCINIRFIVKDTGIGIKKEYFDSIFDSFVQGEHYINKHYTGIGLGLALAKLLIEKIGGSVDFSSEHGKGSTFEFVLPFELPKTKLKSIVACESNEILKGRKILLVEDERVSSMSLQRLLMKYGAQVNLAYDGKQAFDEIISRPDYYDVVLMDINMPNMDGITATQLIREEGITVPIIAVTAFSAESDKIGISSCGMDGYLTKPIDMGILLEAMLLHLK